MAAGITEKLAAHTDAVRFADIPLEAIEKAKDCVLDQIGAELIGSTLEWNKIAYRYVSEMGGRGESTMMRSEHHRQLWQQNAGPGRGICQCDFRSGLRARRRGICRGRSPGVRHGSRRPGAV